MPSHIAKRSVAWIGGTMVTLYFGFRAAADSFGYVGTALNILPAPARAFVASPEGTLFLLLVGFSVLWWAARHPAELVVPDMAAVQDAQLRLRNELDAARDTIARLGIETARLREDAPRHLTADERRIITDRMRPLVEQWKSYGRVAQIGIHAMPGGDCAGYAQEFERLFRDLGFEILSGRMKDWVSDGNQPEDYRTGIYVRHGFTEIQRYNRTEEGTTQPRPMFGDVLHAALLEAGIPAKKLDRRGVLLDLVIGSKDAI